MEIREEMTALMTRHFEEGRALGRAEAQQEFYGQSAAVLTAGIFADAAESAATRLRAHNAQAAGMMTQMAAQLRGYATPANVLSVSPAADATGVALDDQVVVSWQSEMRESLFKDANAYIIPAGGGSHLSVALAYDEESKTLTITPRNAFSPETAYKVVLKGALAAKGGQPMDDDYEFTFTTGAEA